MPTKGQITINPINGDSYEFVETAKDTNGEYITLKGTINTNGLLVPNHYHTLQEESFEVISGQLTIFLDGSISTLSAGQKIVFPKNKPHNHYNNQDIPLIYIHKVVPALDFDFLIETLTKLAIDGKSKNGKYGIFQELVFLKYLDSKSFLADKPLAIQKLLANIIAPIARLFGYRAIYQKYSGIEK